MGLSEMHLFDDDDDSNTDILVYHGSQVEVSNPELRVSRFTKDFGVGFYITKIKHQAERLSNRFSDGIVSVYKFKPNNNLKKLYFESMTDEWLDFIVNCRLGNTHDYDIVEGPMSDDTIYNYVGQFIRGEISRTAFWELVKFSYPTHQIDLCSNKSLSTITFKYSYGVKYNG